VTVVKLNGTSLAGLATGILKNTTSTGVPSIAVAADFPTLNQSTTGNAATATNVAYSGLTGTVPTWNQNTTGTAANITGVLGSSSMPTFTGDVTNSGLAMTVGKLNGTSLASLGSGLLKNTTGTGVPGIAFPGIDYVIPAGNVASATVLFNARTIAGTSFDGSANISLANKFIVQGTTDSGLSGAQFLGALGTCLLKNTTTTGVLSCGVAGTDYLAPTGSSAGLSVGSSSAFGVVKVDGTTITASSGVISAATGIANTTVTIGTTAIAANTCTTVATATMTGLALTSTLNFTPSFDVASTTGWGATGGLTIDAWPSSTNTMSYKTCNQTASSITPGASVTFNVSAR
jgi:hypothetical protein